MWSDWRPDIIESDLKQLSEMGMEVLRVFPLWSDFQPIKLLRGFTGLPQEYRFGEDPLPDTQAGFAGVSEEMMCRFAELIALAEKYHLKLIVSLLTGWMSSRLFVPPALEGRNVLTDPMAMMWQVRFVKYFVKQFIKASPIIAWEPGNECNCMGTATREQAWLWCSAITNAVRSVDPDRSVISGMHGLGTKFNEPWTIDDQAELTDVLTTHPYPLVTPYCDREPINTIRSCLHATVESRLYGDLGGKPCLIEEIGTLGPMIANDTIAGDYARNVLFSAWAHHCQGFLWWCAFDQTHLEQAPYDWCAVERELGLVRLNGQVKPVGQEIKKFGKFLQTLPFEFLPPKITEGVCILTQGQDSWATALGSFILAKQAGIEIEFQSADQPLKSSDLYFLPSVSGLSPISRRRMMAILERVNEGATLYLSINDGFLSSFEDLTGLEVRTREHRSVPSEAIFDEKLTLPILGTIKLSMTPTRATVLGSEADGNPAFTYAEYGKGRIYFLSFPMEEELVKRAGSFHGSDARPYWSIYTILRDSMPCRRILLKTHPQVGVTEHPLDAERRVVVMINYSPQPVMFSFSLVAGWQEETVLYGEMTSKNQVTLKANDAAVLVFRKR
jgi:hypothetical protein